MNIVFLDIDGVLNNFSLIQRHGFDYIDSSMVIRLGRIIDRTGAEIVLSSYWRLDPKDRSVVDHSLGEHGMSVMDVTPRLSGPRANEIRQWLGENRDVVRYAILDDDDEAGIGMEHSFFQTDPEVGITAEIANSSILHLNGGEND